MQSELYKRYVEAYPDSYIARDLRTYGAGGHGHFGDALLEGRYADAMYRADSKNLVKLYNIGLERYLNDEDHKVFMSRYDWAKNHQEF